MLAVHKKTGEPASQINVSLVVCVIEFAAFQGTGAVF